MLRLASGDAVRFDARVDQVADWLVELGDTRAKDELRAVAAGMLAEPYTVIRLWRTIRAQRTGATTEATGTRDSGASPKAGESLPSTVLYLHCHRGTDGVLRWGLEGAGPITTSEAQRLLGHSRVTLTPAVDTGTEITSTSYQAPRSLREQTLVKQGGFCVFPFCGRQVRHGDFDHLVPYPHGPTASHNGALLDRRHHRAKTHGGWQVRQPFPGVYLWRAPTDHYYLVDAAGTHRVTQA